MVSFYEQDIRKEMPEAPFDLIFCKNLVGMYFSKEVANELFRKISERMRTGALLILGNHEEFPVQEIGEIKEVSKGMKIYRKL